MDQEAKQQQFNYPSNLCIQRESGGPRGDDPTGEPETLQGRVDIKLMGTYAAREKAPKTVQKQQKMVKQNGQANVMNPKKKTKINLHGNKGVLDIEIMENLIYKPKTKENRIIYEQILAKINTQIGDESQETIKSVTDEVLAVLKSENMKDLEKKSEIEVMIGKLQQDVFTDLINFSNQINDYTVEMMEDNQDKYEEEMRVNIAFDENQYQDDEEDDDDQQGMIKENDSDEEEDDVQEDQKFVTAPKNIDDNDNSEMVDDKFNIDVGSIDAYWLQTELNKHFDPLQVQKIELDVMKILNLSNDIECENKLVMLLNYDKFDLIKLFLRNRHKIYYCTRLGQAQTKQEREVIVEEMKLSAVGETIIENLEKVKLKKDKELENIKNVQKEAAQLNKQSKNNQIKNEEIIGTIEINDEDFNKITKKIIDLESLVFINGAHHMSNEKCQLPDGSYRQAKKGYDEVYIPAIKRGENEKFKIIDINELPKWSQEAFPKTKSLNRIQSAVYDCAFKQPENMLVCAPTGAGKTNVALLTMLQVIANFRNEQTGLINKDKFKIVYIAPMKALVAEMVGNFQKKLEPFGLTVRELTGDMALSKQQIQETQLIIATPEKWDIITRKSGEKTFTELVKLIIIDEIHLLHDTRGPVLEALVARTIRMIEQTQELIRIVGLSATLPNYMDVAAFLRVNPKTGVFYFDQSYRPIPLEQQYIGITEKKGVRRMLLSNEIVYEKVMERAGRCQMIIFVHSRRETIKTAKALKEMAYSKDELGRFLKEDSASQAILQSETENTKNPDLKELLPYGFAIHHAGLSRLDRNLVEDLFADKHIQVLVSTSTLAWGVNLPAHTVIIKGTQIYSPEQGRWIELSPQDILQMMGRAGRPKYDTKGEGIIITTYSELKYYLSLINTQLPIESQFISQIADQLNAEIVLGSVLNLRDGVNWLGYSYLYIRMLRAHKQYQITDEEIANDSLLIKRRVDLIHSAASLLDKNGLIKYDKKSGNFMTSSLGKIASHYYIKHPSIATYNEQIKPNMGMIEIFRLFTLSQEFKLIPIREEEKIELQKLLESVPLPVKGSQQDPTTKVNVLLQAYISQFKLDGYALSADMVYITQSVGRIMRALFEIFQKRGWAQPAYLAQNCCKMVDRRMWSCMTPLRQFKGIPDEILRRIEKKEQFSWEHFYNMSPQQVGDLVKFPKLGKVLHKFIHQFPRIELTAYVQPITRSCLHVDLTVTPDFMWDDKLHGSSEPFWIFVEDCDGESLIYSEYFVLKKKHIGQKEYLFEFTIPIFEPLHPIYYIRVVSDRWLNCEAQLPLSFKNLILPEKFSPPSELLDLQPLPVKALKWTQAEMMFDQLGIKEFNSIQTQVFSSFFGADETCFLGAPTGFQSKTTQIYVILGSGKTACAILSILRCFKQFPDGKVVYVAPIESICFQKYKEWNQCFKDFFGKNTCILTGQSNADLKLLEKNDVIISRPEHFDVLSRRWKQRKSIHAIKCFIVDEIHLLGESGSVLEVITSRIRIISTQLEKNIRIIALSTSLANYRDVAEWIGATQQNCFNFNPNVRPTPLEIAIQGFDQNNRQARLMSMQKHVFSGIKQHSKDKPVIIFVSDRKQARLTALDIVTFAHSDNDPRKFLKIPSSEIQGFVDQILEKNLKHVLQFGVGFLYEGMDDTEKELVEQLYKIGAIQILISTYKLCWDLTLDAYCVMILDTQRYDGQEKRYVDYTIPDILQMMGRATRSTDNNKQQYTTAKCLVFCHSPKKDYYKKFLYEPYPCESHLNHFLGEHLNTEIVAKTINSKQDCIDWLTWTFFYRRLTQNPNYYNLQEVTGQHINDYLSDIIEANLEELESAKCIAIEDDNDLLPLNLGIIASYYYIKSSTLDHFSKNLSAQSKMQNILEILSDSSEFQVVPIRHREDGLLKGLNCDITYQITKSKFNEPNSKTSILLQCHFSRLLLPPDFCWDQKIILDYSIRLIQAIVDVMSSNCWLKPAILAMQLSQMIIQAIWVTDSPLLQLPHMTKSLVDKFQAQGVEDVADFMNMEDDDRRQILNVPEEQIVEMAEFCNKYPSINLEFEVQDKDSLTAEAPVVVSVSLTRDGDEEEARDFVYAPYFPKAKEEYWWVLIGDNKNNKLYAIKRVNIGSSQNIDLQFIAPEQGTHNLTLYVICDSYLGCDQANKFVLDVKEKKVQEDDDEDEDNQH